MAVAAVIAHRQGSIALAGLGLDRWRNAGAADLETLAGKVERVVPSDRLLIEASRYNKACKTKGGLPALMRWATQTVCEGLMKRYPECKAVVCDPFEPGDVDVSLGSDVLVVMPGEGYRDAALDAARAVARWLYVDRRAAMERKFGVTLDGDAAALSRQIRDRLGEPVLYELAKVDSALAVSLPTGGQP